MVLQEDDRISDGIAVSGNMLADYFHVVIKI